MEGTFLMSSIEQEHTFYRQIFDVLDTGVVVLDPAGKITMNNSRFCDMMGKGKEDLIDHSIEQVFQNLTVESLLTKPILPEGVLSINIASSAQKQPPDIFRLKYSHILNRKKSITAIVIMVSKVAPEPGANETGNFIQKAYHLLRTPIATIAGVVSLTKYENEESRLRSYLQLIERNIQLLDHKLIKFMETARINNRFLKISPVVFRGLIEDAISDLELPDTDMIIDLDHTYPVMGDPPLLRLVFRQLIRNAADQQYPDLEKAPMRISSVNEDDGIRIFFEDKGARFPSTGQDHGLYNPSPDEKVRVNYREGLHQVKLIIDQHQGSFSLDYHPGKGILITLKLPGDQISAP